MGCEGAAHASWRPRAADASTRVGTTGVTPDRGNRVRFPALRAERVHLVSFAKTASAAAEWWARTEAARAGSD
jgi:hypothetical protein